MLKNPIFIVLLAMGLIFTYIAISHLLDKRYSKSTEGEITFINVSDNSKMPVITFYVEGKQYIFESAYSSSTMEVGQKVPVKYDPENPNRARIDTVFVINFLMLGFALFTIMLAFIVGISMQKISIQKEKFAAIAIEEARFQPFADETVEDDMSISGITDNENNNESAPLKKTVLWILLLPLFLFFIAFVHLKNPIILHINGVTANGIYDGWDNKLKMPVISFQDDKGKKYSFTSQYKPGDFVEGDKVPVLYLKDNPAKAGTAWWSEMGGGLLALILGVIVLFIFFWVIKNWNYI